MAPTLPGHTAPPSAKTGELDHARGEAAKIIVDHFDFPTSRALSDDHAWHIAARCSRDCENLMSRATART
jgi:hypothetical protein